MKPKPQSRDTFELFQAHFNQILNPEHELIKLANQIDWSRFEAAYADSYCEDFGAPAKATRLMVGLHYLKYAFNESDESMVARWLENPYWQYFCGYTHMQYECPIHPTSMTKWRNRVGAERLEMLLKETIDLAVREKYVSPGDLQRVNVDTTVQEKNVTFPTDSKLLYKAIVKLVKAAQKRGIYLRQSYLRVGKAAALLKPAVTPMPSSINACSGNSANYGLMLADSFVILVVKSGLWMKTWRCCWPWRIACVNNGLRIRTNCTACTSRRSSASAKAKPTNDMSLAKKSL